PRGVRRERAGGRLQQPGRRCSVGAVNGASGAEPRGGSRLRRYGALARERRGVARRTSIGSIVSTVSRQQYASLYGPTAGHRFRLADTSLIARVERTMVLPGEEAIYGGGKSLRDGMGQMPGVRNADGALDLVITSVVIMDPVIGIVKADIGVKDGKIVALG